MSIRTVDGELRTVRGTTNGNARGSSEDRRRRREWLVMTYRANVDAQVLDREAHDAAFVCIPRQCPHWLSVPACRCYRCGELLTVDTVTVDRIVPGCKGGTYRRNNIRPACQRCNSETGGGVRS
ncbi:MAG: HNH endonuclease [Nocardioides sp.]|uniref:HNH endonuclease n=1 Tax=Nocardioides sp. TaxID=35761 RepID=UPI0039E3FA30